MKKIFILSIYAIIISNNAEKYLLVFLRSGTLQQLYLTDTYKLAII